MREQPAPTALHRRFAPDADGLRARLVLNAYDYGGYLIFRGVKVFIDGRTDMYRAAFPRNNGRLGLGDQAAIRAPLARYKIAWTILPAHSRAAEVMDRLKGWRRAHGDTMRWCISGIDYWPPG